MGGESESVCRSTDGWHRLFAHTHFHDPLYFLKCPQIFEMHFSQRRAMNKSCGKPIYCVH